MGRRGNNLKELGKFCYQLSGYSYAGVVLAEIVKLGGRSDEALKFGIVTAVCFAVLGFILISISNKIRR